MKEYIKIDEGATHEYLIHGVVLFLIGLICFLLHWLVALILLIAAVGLMNIKTGIEIDFVDKQIRKYKNFFGYHFGDWLDLTNFISAELRFNSQISKNNIVFRPFYLGEVPGSLKTYDLILIDDVEGKLLFNPFAKVGLAMQAIKALEDIDGLEVTNHVDNWVEQQLNRRRRR